LTADARGFAGIYFFCAGFFGRSAAVLSYGFWQRRFAGNMRAGGRYLSFRGNRLLVVEVMPESFNPASPLPQYEGSFQSKRAAVPALRAIRIEPAAALRDDRV
jgi:hypothetical protein